MLLVFYLQMIYQIRFTTSEDTAKMHVGHLYGRYQSLFIPESSIYSLEVKAFGFFSRN